MDHDPKMLEALAGISLSDGQLRTISEAWRADEPATRRLIQGASDARAPGAVIYSAAPGIVRMAELAEQVQDTTDTARIEKRLRSLRNYSKMALPMVPALHREEVVREEFPWATDDVVAEALMIAEENPEVDDSLVRWEKQQAWHAFERQVATLGEADAYRWVRQPGMWHFDPEPMIKHYEKLRSEGVMEPSLLRARMRKLYPTMADTWREPAEKPAEPKQPDEPMKRAGFTPPA